LVIDLPRCVFFHFAQQSFLTNPYFTAFKTKVKPFIGAKSLLLAIGFAQGENDPTHLVLKEDADIQVIKDTKTKLEAAFVAFG